MFGVLYRAFLCCSCHAWHTLCQKKLQEGSLVLSCLSSDCPEPWLQTSLQEASLGVRDGDCLSPRG